MRSNWVIWSLYQSFLAKMFSAFSGTFYSSNLKYFTSLNNLTRAGSKLTFNFPLSFLVIRGRFNLASDQDSTSFSHERIFSLPYQFICLVIDSCNFKTSLYSSRSLIIYPKDFSLSKGSSIRYKSPLDQVWAPEIGGILLKIGAYSMLLLSIKAFPSKKMDWTVFKSYLQVSNKMMCFFSNSS